MAKEAKEMKEGEKDESLMEMGETAKESMKAEEKPETASFGEGSAAEPAAAAGAAAPEETPAKSIEKFEAEQFPQKQVSSIMFSVLSPKMIKDMASAKIVTPELYDKEGYPVDGGLMDIRLGVIDPGLRCKTCGSKLKECIGHFGY